ncbi:hypothetical protein SAMN04488065_0053 [Haloplanus vescus]|uniref:RecA-superfamily ATPase, KaiC/GvpD/RAD55 family n=1 Tax=Haloplanus vescus TaxID=555874 RepID=A0A1H3VL16_9EURY|nr:hypothetical protein [Haloplanus vescus]SDZ75429.1 hypothetical protein SAMN04488065_0053 [Haloplanus vescus]
MVAGGGMGPDDEGVSFAHALATLKEQGSALLVVGSVPEEMFADASATMLGDPSADPPRRRLVVTPEPNQVNGVSRLRETGPLSSEYARLVTRGEAARSAAADRPLDQVSPRTHVVDGTVYELGSTIAEVIDEFDLFAGGLAPAEFRMAFDCLPTLLSTYGREAAFRFLHLTIAQARAVSGLVHFRLPRALDSEIVRLFQPLFDATVELRIDGGNLDQRWHFRDRDLTSDWLPIDRST